MTYELNVESAKQADNIVSAIKDAGKYTGTITRAEKLLSRNGTEGLGLSFKSGDGQTADYLDIYTTKSNGEALMGAKTVNALMACLKLRKAVDGPIRFEKWNKETKKREQVEATGYPDMMGKPIGLLLQKELGTHDMTGADTTKMVIFGVFSPSTELTASEILDGKTNPERLPKMVEALMARPVRDNRASDKRAPVTGKPAATGFDDMDEDIPF